jgi:hypothetical protein
MPRVLLHGEQTDGRISVTESAMSAGAKGPPLHAHAFDETFYVLDGELTFQLGDALRSRSRARSRLRGAASRTRSPTVRGLLRGF